MHTYYNSPIGTLKIVEANNLITHVDFVERTESIHSAQSCDILNKCLKELDNFFTKKSKSFSIKLTQTGTDFQMKVWHEIATIPFGTTTTYGTIAKKILCPKAMRAVGASCGSNRIAIIVPCHRVVGADNKITGYAGGIWRKEWLLNFEKQ